VCSVSVNYLAAILKLGDRNPGQSGLSFWPGFFVFEDGPDNKPQFNNEYERSKFAAEQMVVQYAKESVIPYTIYNGNSCENQNSLGQTISSELKCVKVVFRPSLNKEYAIFCLGNKEDNYNAKIVFDENWLCCFIRKDGAYFDAADVGAQIWFAGIRRI